LIWKKNPKFSEKLFPIVKLKKNLVANMEKYFPKFRPYFTHFFLIYFPGFTKIILLVCISDAMCRLRQNKTAWDRAKGVD
jgi:hypothetical protein